MTAIPDMEFRRLEGDDVELAVALAASLADIEDERREGWGLGKNGSIPLGCEAWGVLIRGGLAGALWLAPAVGGVVEVKTLVLPRGRWGMGLVQWLLERTVEPVKNSGAKALTVTLASGSGALGEMLEEAGFTGPGLDEETYPVGKWMRQLAPQVPVNRFGADAAP